MRHSLYACLIFYRIFLVEIWNFSVLILLGLQTITGAAVRGIIIIIKSVSINCGDHETNRK